MTKDCPENWPQDTVCKTWELDEVKIGWVISWQVVTQAQWDIYARMTDENGKVYFDKMRCDLHAGFLSEGIDVNAGGHLKLTIGVPRTSRGIHGPVASGNLHNDEGDKVVGGYWLLSQEAGSDQDYNDVSACVMGWANRG